MTRSSMRTRMKLAGTKDMAKTTQMETSTSTEEAILGVKGHELLREELCSSLMGLRSLGLDMARGGCPEPLRTVRQGEIVQVSSRIDVDATRTCRQLGETAAHEA